MSLGRPSLRMSTGVPSKEAPLASGISLPTAGSVSPPWGSSGRAVPVTVTGRVCSAPAAELFFFLSLPPPEETSAATARTTTTAATPIHSQGGCFLRAAATALDFDFGLGVAIGRLLTGYGQQGDDEGEARQRHRRDRQVAEALHPDEGAGILGVADARLPLGMVLEGHV